MQNKFKGKKGKGFNKPGKPKPPFKKKPKAGDVEDQEIKSLQERYNSVDVAVVQTFDDLPLSKKTIQGNKSSHHR